MFPLQSEVGFVVVELRLSPVALVVTIPALLAKSTLMRLVGLMAGHALWRSITVLFARFVAIRTGDLDMPPKKWELSHAMVKGVWIQSDNVRISTYVFGMAMLAVDTRNVGNSAVEASLPGDILIDVFMTKKAQVVLSVLFETAMTLVTVIFELGVALNNRPRHD